jgi:hypothetical protein
MGMNGKAALYYREQQTLEAAILLREMLACTSGHDKVLQRCENTLPQVSPHENWLSGL